MNNFLLVVVLVNIRPEQISGEYPSLAKAIIEIRDAVMTDY